MATKTEKNQEMKPDTDTVQDTSAPAAPAVKERKRVKLFVPRAEGGDDPNQMISVNCVNYLLPKGKESEVPEYVAKEYLRSQSAANRYDNTVAELLKQTEEEKKKIAALQ